MVERAAKTPEIEHAFGRPIEGNAHAIEQIDDRRRSITHCLHRRLVGEKVATEYGVVQVLPGGVALTFEVLCGIDAALRADGVRALDGNNGEQVDVTAGLGDLNDSSKARQPSSHDDDLGCSHQKPFTTEDTKDHEGEPVL